jgi:hypothetical protein
VQGFDSAGKEKNSFDELVEIRALLTAADSSTMRHMILLAANSEAFSQQITVRHSICHFDLFEIRNFKRRKQPPRKAICFTTTA